jgi:hypothetical protein
MGITPRFADGFTSLCQEIGLAVLLSQKVQFALAHYYALAVAKPKGWKQAQVKESIALHLSRPMGTVVKAIREEAPLETALASEVEAFLKARNWLVHTFDQEATPELSQGKMFQFYAERMQAISVSADQIMRHLDTVGSKMFPSAA